MRKLISVIKVFLFISGTLCTYIVYAFGLFFIKIFGLHFEPWRNKAMTIWGNLSAFFLSINIDVKGTPPEPPFFLVSNHLSYLDIVVLSATLKTTFVSKSEVSEWPVLGIMSKSLGIIFVDRRKKMDVKRVNRIISEQINDRQGVTIFPEGKTSPGKNVLPFRPSLLEYPANTNMEVSYATICYETSDADVPAYQSVNWWGKAQLHKHLLLMGQNKTIRATLKFGENKLMNKDRKKLAKQLHKEVESLFEPMADEPVENLEPVIYNN